MPLGDQGLTAAIGASLFAAITQDLSALLHLNGVPFPVTRPGGGSDDIYGQPKASPTTFTATLLLADQQDEERPTLAGGRHFEVLTLIGQPGALLMNDVVAYENHNYDVRCVMRSTLGSTVQCDVYEAQREVDPGA